MRHGHARSHRPSSGFTLTELAIVMAIVAVALAGAMYAFSVQVEQRNFEETRRRLELARELLFAFAITKGRLPCPARSTSSGAEVIDASGNCRSGGVDDYYGGALAGGVTGGLLPAQTIGFQQVDASGFALDAWGNRIRYAVAKNIANCSSASPVTPHFTMASNLKINGISCQPNDLLVCKSATGLNAGSSPPSCGGGGANQIMSTGLVVAIVFSSGKNETGGGGTGVDEQSNLKTNTALVPQINALFVYHTPTPATAANGEFDDQFTWITHGELYGRLISAGVLP